MLVRAFYCNCVNDNLITALFFNITTNDLTKESKYWCIRSTEARCMHQQQLTYAHIIFLAFQKPNPTYVYLNDIFITVTWLYSCSNLDKLNMSSQQLNFAIPFLVIVEPVTVSESTENIDMYHTNTIWHAGTSKLRLCYTIYIAWIVLSTKPLEPCTCYKCLLFGYFVIPLIWICYVNFVNNC